MKTFTIHATVQVVLPVNAIWPDGQAPDNPTPNDVIDRLMLEDRYRPLAAMDTWNLNDRTVVQVWEGNEAVSPDDGARWYGR